MGSCIPDSRGISQALSDLLEAAYGAAGMLRKEALSMEELRKLSLGVPHKGVFIDLKEALQLMVCWLM